MPVMVIECIENIILLLDDWQQLDSRHQMALSYEHLYVYIRLIPGK